MSTSVATAEPVEFRDARAADVDAIVALVESAYRGAPSHRGWTTEAELLGGQRTDRQEVESLIADPEARVVLAVLACQIVGCVLVRREDSVAYVGMFAINPSLQNAGIGRRLLEEAERRARCEFGLLRAKMTVIEQRRELIAWYVRRGYADTGRTEPFPYGNPRFGLPKRDDLRFVVLEKSLA